MRAASMLRRLTVGQVTLALAVCLALGVGWTLVTPLFDHTDPEIRAIQGLPGYGLRYPGATLLVTVAQPSTLAHGGTTGAEVIEVFGMHAASRIGDVVLWYNRRLAPYGWQLTAAEDIESFAPQLVWARGCYDLRIVSGDAQVLPPGKPTPDTRAYGTVYGVTIEHTCVAPGSGEQGALCATGRRQTSAALTITGSESRTLAFASLCVR